MSISTDSKKSLKSLSEDLLEKFHTHFDSCGYIKHDSVMISSGIDNTVRFIGSHISVLKPYFIEGTIPEEGFFISQNSIRTKNLKIITNPEIPLTWGSYFCNFGALVKPDQLFRICNDTFYFLETVLGYKPEDIRIRVNSKDLDLLNASRQRYENSSIEIDTFKLEYYRHNYGLEGISGRNFNIAIKNKHEENFADIGNIVVIERGDEAIGVELGLGNSTILKQQHDLGHVLDIYNIPNILALSEDTMQKLKDCIIVTSTLFREKLRPSGSRGVNQSFRKYIEELSQLCLMESISLNALFDMIETFEKNEFGEITGVSKKIIAKIEEIRKNNRYLTLTR